MDTLSRIQRLVVANKLLFAQKARQEMDVDGLTDDDVAEAILNAAAIDKVLRSTSRWRRKSRERLYIIKGVTYGGLSIYTKGTSGRRMPAKSSMS